MTKIIHLKKSGGFKMAVCDIDDCFVTSSRYIESNENLSCSVCKKMFPWIRLLFCREHFSSNSITICDSCENKIKFLPMVDIDQIYIFHE